MSQSNGYPSRPSSRNSQDKKQPPRSRSQHNTDVRPLPCHFDAGVGTESLKQPHQQASQIEKSVTHLLVATKQLLETLTQWSRGAATETEVSDVYVRLGYEFNIACRSFISVGIDTQDLGPVPDTLRSILEDTLAQEASQQSLDRYLPRIRDIIINLLHGLKRKQQKLRQKTGRDGAPSILPVRSGSVASTAASNAEDDPSRQSSRTSYVPHRADSRDGQSPPQLPPVDADVPNGRSSPTKEPDFPVPVRRSSIQHRTLSTTPIHQPSFPAEPQNQAQAAHGSTKIATTLADPDSPILQNATNKPPAGEQDALAALQRGGDLERRASRRFSQYQIQKHLGTSSIGMPSMPPQMSPIPNRGRDAQDSSHLSRMRSSQTHHRPRSKQSIATDSLTQRLDDRREEHKSAPQLSAEQLSTETLVKHVSSEGAETALSPTADSPSKSRMSATITKFTDFSAPPPYMSIEESPAIETPPQNDFAATSDPSSEETTKVTAIPTEPAALEPEQEEPTPSSEVVAEKQEETSSRPLSSGPLTLFLQYKKRVKKFVLANGYAGLSLARLQLAFIEKFAWNTHSNGVDLPEIYIQDAESGVRHELEDLTDVKDYSILVLNIDDLDEVKRHFDDSFDGLKTVIEAVKTAVGDNQTALQRVSDRQQEAAVDMARIAVAPARTSGPVRSAAAHFSASSGSFKGTPAQLQEVQGLRRELAVMRQTYSSHLANMETSMAALRTKAAAVSKAAIAASSPPMIGDSGRAYVDRSKNQLSEDSEKIINRVDDLQDLVEELRKDVVTRGVRPLPRQLESVSKDIQHATAELRKLRELIKHEKPIWTKVGENELKAVCDDQNLLNLQEELAADLEDDLQKASQTFALVEQATKQQNLQAGNGHTASRQTSRTLTNGEPVDPLKAKSGVLGEVRALQPNHETRLEAIERAEKARQLELESRRDGEFQREVRTFVEQGKLKKSGGFEEAERQRENKDEAARRAIWERMGGKSVYQDPAMEAAAEAQRAALQANDSLDLPSASSKAADDGGLTSPGEEFVEASEAPLMSPSEEASDTVA